MTSKMSRSLMKILVLFTTLTFASTNLFAQAPQASIAPIQNSRLVEFTKNFQIPSDLGEITSLSIPQSGASEPNKLFIHIQDAHANEVAQRKIVSILEYLHENYGINTFGFEGAQGSLDPQVLQISPNQKTNMKIADYLLKKGELTGGEFFTLKTAGAADRPRELVASGIEDGKIYSRDLKLFRQGLSNAEQLGAVLDKLVSSVNRVKNGEFSKELNKFDRLYQSFRSRDDKNVLQFFEEIRRKAKSVLDQDINDPRLQRDYPQLVRLANMSDDDRTINAEQAKSQSEKIASILEKSQSNAELIAIHQNILKNIFAGKNPSREPFLSWRECFESMKSIVNAQGYHWKQFDAFQKYAKRLILQEELMSLGMFQEIDSIVYQIEIKIASSENDMNLINLDRDMRAFLSLMKLEALRNDVDGVGKDRSGYYDDIHMRFENATAGGSGITQADWYNLHEQFDLAMKFYDGAGQREKAFVSRLTELSDQNQSNFAVFVTGGFHTKGIGEELQKNNIGFISIMPALPAEDTAALAGRFEKLYEEGMLGRRKTIFDKSGIVDRLIMVSPEEFIKLEGWERDWVKEVMESIVREGIVPLVQDLRSADPTIDSLEEIASAIETRLRENQFLAKENVLVQAVDGKLRFSWDSFRSGYELPADALVNIVKILQEKEAPEPVIEEAPELASKAASLGDSRWSISKKQVIGGFAVLGAALAGIFAGGYYAFTRVRPIEPSAVISETIYAPDGSKEIVIEDGTVKAVREFIKEGERLQPIEPIEPSAGRSETIYAPDGSSSETIYAPDGSKERVIEYDSDGIVKAVHEFIKGDEVKKIERFEGRSLGAEEKKAEEIIQPEGKLSRRTVLKWGLAAASTAVLGLTEAACAPRESGGTFVAVSLPVLDMSQIALVDDAQTSNLTQGQPGITPPGQQVPAGKIEQLTTASVTGGSTPNTKVFKRTGKSFTFDFEHTQGQFSGITFSRNNFDDNNGAIPANILPDDFIDANVLGRELVFNLEKEKSVGLGRIKLEFQDDAGNRVAFELANFNFVDQPNTTPPVHKATVRVKLDSSNFPSNFNLRKFSANLVSDNPINETKTFRGQLRVNVQGTDGLYRVQAANAAVALNQTSDLLPLIRPTLLPRAAVIAPIGGAVAFNDVQLRDLTTLITEVTARIPSGKFGGATTLVDDNADPLTDTDLFDGTGLVQQGALVLNHQFMPGSDLPDQTIVEIISFDLITKRSIRYRTLVEGLRNQNQSISIPMTADILPDGFVVGGPQGGIQSLPNLVYETAPVAQGQAVVTKNVKSQIQFQGYGNAQSSLASVGTAYEDSEVTNFSTYGGVSGQSTIALIPGSAPGTQLNNVDAANRDLVFPANPPVNQISGIRITPPAGQRFRLGETIRINEQLMQMAGPLNNRSKVFVIQYNPVSGQPVQRSLPVIFGTAVPGNKIGYAIFTNDVVIPAGALPGNEAASIDIFFGHDFDPNVTNTNNITQRVTAQAQSLGSVADKLRGAEEIEIFISGKDRFTIQVKGTFSIDVRNLEPEEYQDVISALYDRKDNLKVMNVGGNKDQIRKEEFISYLGGEIKAESLGDASQALINEIRLNRAKFLKKGALVFDVDGTILNKKGDQLGNYPDFIDGLLTLMKQGVPVAIISGNSVHEQMPRIVNPIRSALGADQSPISRLTLYANGGATRIDFNESGNPVRENAYNQQFYRITDEDLKNIQSALVELGKKQFGLTPEQVTEWQKWYAGIKDFGPVTFELPWTKSEGGYEAPVIPVGEMRGMVQAPWVEDRDRVQLSIKLLPKTPVDIRLKEVAASVKRVLGPNADRFDYYPGGFASLDINPKGVNKAIALTDLIEAFDRDPSQVFYFGDEFYRQMDEKDSKKIKKLGNDVSILEVSAVRPVAVNEAANALIDDPNHRISWIGHSPQATHQTVIEIANQVGAASLGRHEFDDLREIIFKELKSQARSAKEVKNLVSGFDPIYEGNVVEVHVLWTILVQRYGQILGIDADEIIAPLWKAIVRLAANDVLKDINSSEPVTVVTDSDMAPFKEFAREFFIGSKIMSESMGYDFLIRNFADTENKDFNDLVRTVINSAREEARAGSLGGKIKGASLGKKTAQEGVAAVQNSILASPDLTDSIFPLLEALVIRFPEFSREKIASIYALVTAQVLAEFIVQEKQAPAVIQHQIQVLEKVYATFGRIQQGYGLEVEVIGEHSLTPDSEKNILATLRLHPQLFLYMVSTSPEKLSEHAKVMEKIRNATDFSGKPIGIRFGIVNATPQNLASELRRIPVAVFNLMNEFGPELGIREKPKNQGQLMEHTVIIGVPDSLEAADLAYANAIKIQNDITETSPTFISDFAVIRLLGGHIAVKSYAGLSPELKAALPGKKASATSLLGERLAELQKEIRAVIAVLVAA